MATELIEAGNGHYLVPDTWAQTLLTTPVKTKSIAALVSTTYPMQSGALALHVPVITQDPTADWVNEGQAIPEGNMETAEIVAVPSKVAGLKSISNEVRRDGGEAVLNAVGEGLSRDIRRKIDAAFFGPAGKADKTDIRYGYGRNRVPLGLASLEGVTEIKAGADWKNIDPFVSAINRAAASYANITSFVANPADVEKLALLKRQKDSNEPLLQAQTPLEGVGTVHAIDGVPLYAAPAVEEGTVWGIPKDRAHMAIWNDTQIVLDESVHFTRDMTAVRGVMRVAFAFPQPEAIFKIKIGA